jgi:hypothetical protein
MKPIATVSIMILVLVTGGSCATGKKVYVSKEDEELFSTWVNPDYDES